MQRDIIDSLSERWKMQPVFARADLPNSHISLVRWRCDDPPQQKLGSTVSQDAYVLSFIVRPMRARVWLDKRSIWTGPIASRSLRLIRPGSLPEWLPESPFDIFHFHIPRRTFDLVSEATEAAGRADALRDPLYSSEPTIARLAEDIIAATGRSDPFVIPYIDGLTVALVSQVLFRYAYQGELQDCRRRLSQQALEAVRAYVARNLDHELTIDVMASVAELSPSHFARSFARTTGVTPHRYVLRARLEQSSLRLSENDESVLDIALSCGFKDPSHFARVFAKEFGHSPRQHRRK